MKQWTQNWAPSGENQFVLATNCFSLQNLKRHVCVCNCWGTKPDQCNIALQVFLFAFRSVDWVVDWVTLLIGLLIGLLTGLCLAFDFFLYAFLDDAHLPFASFLNDFQVDTNVLSFLYFLCFFIKSFKSSFTTSTALRDGEDFKRFSRRVNRSFLNVKYSDLLTHACNLTPHNTTPHM